MKSLIILISTIASSIGIDQLIKWLVRSNMLVGQTIPVIDDIFHITYIRNEGAAFGILSEHRWVFMTFSTIAIIAIGVYLFKFCEEPLFTKIGLALIVGGGIGNMIDRIILKYVVDMIDCRFIDFYIFNFADCCVCVGSGMVILGLIHSLAKDIRRKRAKEIDAPDGEQENNEDTGC
ncbi:MAG: signal peptidase II [Clostridia bacterium]|nr:signal peptidase II [Clostridia bacterium]